MHTYEAECEQPERHCYEGAQMIDAIMPCGGTALDYKAKSGFCFVLLARGSGNRSLKTVISLSL